MSKIFKTDKPLVFIVGNSRSGTTMMGRIVGKHSEVFTFHELHFFEQLRTVQEQNDFTSESEAEQLAARLFCIQRDGYLNQKNPNRFLSEAKELVAKADAQNSTSASIFKEFLFYESAVNNKVIPCEQTPRNVFYINEILKLYPEAKIINMIRDPRDVLLSQKRKWKRRFLGAHKIPLREAIRSKINYHPIIISKLWNSSIYAADKFADHDQVYSLYFEELLKEPEVKVKEICDFIGISFNQDLLQVPQVGSSMGLDRPEQKGVDPTKTKHWQKGGLSKTEVFLCQQITKSLREKHGYYSTPTQSNPLKLIYSLISLPIQLTLILLVNFNRMRGLKEAIKKRLI
ncbi:sulfotransferase family protein [Pleurocapsa sp. FMAR1]|uniref:sulfotransferase family protein n=1 Tax=Pleurocapsa sp. FMAR1 TaxID=3040204 RepID=UPI0029C88404|nr:sulfotransferase [Pleurocapsa sp. FMAR1]